MEKCCKRGGHSPRAAFFGGNGKSVAKGAAAEEVVRSRRPTRPGPAWLGLARLGFWWGGGVVKVFF